MEKRQDIEKKSRSLEACIRQSHASTYSLLFLFAQVSPCPIAMWSVTCTTLSLASRCSNSTRLSPRMMTTFSTLSATCPSTAGCTNSTGSRYDRSLFFDREWCNVRVLLSNWRWRHLAPSKILRVKERFDVWQKWVIPSLTLYLNRKAPWISALFPRIPIGQMPCDRSSNKEWKNSGRFYSSDWFIGWSFELPMQNSMLRAWFGIALAPVSFWFPFFHFFLWLVAKERSCFLSWLSSPTENWRLRRGWLSCNPVRWTSTAKMRNLGKSVFRWVALALLIQKILERS